MSKFDWEEYLKFAEDTISQVTTTNLPIPQSKDEAKIRATISRAYYAVFNLAKEFADDEWFSYDKRSVHEDLIRHFNDAKNTNRQKVSVNLQRLRTDRVDADYKSTHMQWSKASSAVIIAKQTLEILDNL